MSEPVYDVRFVDDQGREISSPKGPAVREWLAVILILVGTIALSVGIGGYLDSLYAGVAVAGLVLTGLGLLLGNNK